MKFRERLMLACAGMLCLACITVFLRYGTYEYLIRTLGWDNAWTSAIFVDNAELQHPAPPQNGDVPIDWAAKYPYDPAPSEATPEDNCIEQSRKAFRAQATSFERWTNERFFAYKMLPRFMHACLRSAGWNISSLDSLGYGVFQYADGRLAIPMTRKDVHHPVDGTVALASFCKDRGIHFVVLLVPWKFSQASPYNGTLDFSNANLDAYLSGLREHDVDAIDLRTCIKEAGTPYDDFFIKTDHHWTLASARWAASLLDRHLSGAYGYPSALALLSASRFREERYPAWHLGTLGNQLTLPAEDSADFYLFYPEYPTSFQISIPSKHLERQGDFSIFYDTAQMKPGTYTYETYAYGNQALLTIRNERKNDGSHLLFLHDSYGSAATPFLALGADRLDSIDPRCFTGSLRTYIEKERPDTVILCYGAIEFNLDDAMNLPRKAFDFR